MSSTDPLLYTDPTIASYHNVGVEIVATVPTASSPASSICVYGIGVTNGTSSTRYLQLFDGYQTPSAGTMPVIEIQIAPNSQGGFDPGCFRRVKLNTGIVVVSSTTSGTYTAGGSTDFSFLFVAYLRN